MERSSNHHQELIQIFEVPALLMPYVDAALARLNYLYSHVDFACKAGFVCVSHAEKLDLPSLKSEVAHALYREKILQDTLPLRRSLYTRIFGR